MKDFAEKKARLVAANIRKVREFRNYTQDYLAMKLEISQNAYSKLELGHTPITISRLFHVSLLLDISVAELISNEPVGLIVGFQPLAG